MVRILASLLFFALIGVYAAPSVIAVLRARRRWPLVVALNLLLGWTIIGWLAALAMALGLRLPTPKRRIKARARRVPASPPAGAQVVASDAVPEREPAEPPKLRDDSYSRWLDGGSAMTA